MNKRFRFVRVATPLSLAAFGASSQAAAIDVADVVADIALQAGPIALVGGAVLVIYGAVKAFKWVRAAMS